MMALTTVSQALDITKKLKEIGKQYDEATFKMQIADLMAKLTDLKISFSEAKESILERDERIRELKREIASLKMGEICPICKTGNMEVTSSRAHPELGIVGVQEQTVTCTNSECNHSEKRVHDPNNILKS